MSKYKFRRVNLYGGPGCGKSTAAAKLFAACKDAGITAEWIQEGIKMDAYLGNSPKGYKQLELFADQAQREFNLLSCGVDLVICDAPVLLNVYYTLLHGGFGWHQMEDIAVIHHQMFPSVDIFINRGERKFNPKGRFQTEEDARELDDRIRAYISETISTRCPREQCLFPVVSTEDVVPCAMGMLKGAKT